MNKSINTIKVQLPEIGRSEYPILIGNDVLSVLRKWLLKQYIGRKVVIITDTNVANLHANSFADLLRSDGHDVVFLEVKPGEVSKSAKVKQKLELSMLEHKVNRYSICLAFGGGVVGDLAGFVSATYMRGIAYVQVPTTTLAMVDSSVGGKTAINTKFGKNMIGAFWQPSMVASDLNCLTSLRTHHFFGGLIEAVKMFLTNNAKAFHYVAKNLTEILAQDERVIAKVIADAIIVKATVVAEDEKEQNLRMVLNFGHTIGHAIEKIKHYKMPHAEAVGLGILVEAKIATIMGLLSEADFIAITEVLTRLGTKPAKLAKMDIDAINQALLLDKKNKHNEINCILLNGIGSVALYDGDKVATPITQEVVKQAMLFFQR